VSRVDVGVAGDDGLIQPLGEIFAADSLQKQQTGIHSFNFW